MQHLHRFLAPLFVVLVLGAGCTTTTTVTPGIETPEVEPTAQALSCPEGTTLFRGAAVNVEFCYPTTDDNGNEIRVKEEEDGVVLVVAGSTTPARKVAVVTVDPATPREDIVAGYIADGTMTFDPVCTVQLTKQVAGRSEYVIQGAVDGDYGLDAHDQCNSEVTAGLLNGIGDGTFMFFDANPSVMLVLTGEQDASLGYAHTQEFVDSLQPKE